MRIVFLPRANGDLLWFRRYYRQVFSEGGRSAARSYREALERLAQTPFIGPPVPDRPVRAYRIARTPFLLIYRVKDDRIEVLRVWDARAERVEAWVDE